MRSSPVSLRSFPFSAFHSPLAIISHQSSVLGGLGVGKEDHPTYEMTTHFSRPALIAGESPDVKKDGFSKRRAIMVATNRPSSLKGETNDIIHRS